jgi:hypothetical protein
MTPYLEVGERSPPAAAVCRPARRERWTISRSITWLAVKVGYFARTRAATPATNALANDAPFRSTGPSSPGRAFTGASPDRATVRSPGEATPTHGPFIDNSAGRPASVTAATGSTSGAYHAGVTMVCTALQPNGSAGLAADGAGFWTHEPAVLSLTFPAAARYRASPSPMPRFETHSLHR